MCTGSGCIAVSLSQLTSWQVEALDISPEAVALARQNAAGSSAKHKNNCTGYF